MNASNNFWKNSARKALGVGLLSCLLGASVALAISDDFDEEPPMPASASGSKNPRREYAGGRDDQALEVQASLPSPTRSPDGNAFASPSGGGDGADDEPSHD